MIDIHYRRGALALEVRGHAGAGLPGSDPVCAGVSALVLTLAGNVAELAAQDNVREPVICLDRGNARVGCRPKKSMEPVVTLVFDTVWTGLTVLSGLYPKYISCRVTD